MSELHEQVDQVPALRRLGEVVWELARDRRAGMHVPVRVFADEALLSQISGDHSLRQLLNVSTLPGVTRAALGMPDMHEGYGFPVGGVAATLLPHGVISPGGIGFDINCGVRLLASGLSADTVKDQLPAFMHELSRSVPTGYGRHGRLTLDQPQLDKLLEGGVPHLISRFGFGTAEDLEFIESGGRLPAADAACVSDRAKLRGSDQLGTLGGGNHFVEVQRVDAIYDAAAARAFGLFAGQLTVLIHTGSRGLGHQVCTDSVGQMDAAMPGHGISLPDRQLACAPFSSAEGRRYFAAMSAAANFAWCNRQTLTHRCREVFTRILGAGTSDRLRLVYDVAHNIAKVERYGGRELCVHRKGATRAFGPSNPELPPAYRSAGQPVFIPGSMGTASFVLAGRDSAAEVSLNSCCHGAGRVMSRGTAKRTVKGQQIRAELQARGIIVKCPSNAELAEEAPLAYKDVERVVQVVERAGIAGRVARLVPLGVLKG